MGTVKQYLSYAKFLQMSAVYKISNLHKNFGNIPESQSTVKLH